MQTLPLCYTLNILRKFINSQRAAFDAAKFPVLEAFHVFLVH